MNTVSSLHMLRSFAKNERAVFTTGDLARILGLPRSGTELNDVLRALCAAGILIRPLRGVYVLADMAGDSVLERIAAAARRGYLSVVSLETAAARWGLIEQQYPGLLTVVTQGREGTFETPWGRLEFCHTELGREDLLAGCVDGGVLPMTDRAMTVRLLKRMRRPSAALLKEDDNEF